MDGELHCTTIGQSGDYVVFLHGLFGQGKNFSTVAKALQPELRSILVDLPNHGKSPWTERFDYLQAADAVAQTITTQVPTGARVHLVGHSLGGKVAMLVALAHRELIDRLVVVDIAPENSGGTDEFDHLLGSLAELDLATLDQRETADRLLSAPIPDPTVRQFLLQNLRRSADARYAWQANLSVLRRDLALIGAWPAEAIHGLPAFDHPVLWIAGERSSYISESSQAPMRALFPRTRLVTIKQSGHWVHSAQPEAFIAVLRAFLLS